MSRDAALLAVALLVGCASDERTQAPNDAPRGVRHQLPIAEGAAPPPPAQAALPRPAASPKRAEPAHEEEETEAEKEERDYSAELLAAVGTPVHCLKQRVKSPDVPSEIRIDINATVVEVGLVTRAYVRSSHLDDEELKCVEEHVSRLRMRGPIEEAPRSISTTFVVELKPAAAPAAPAAPASDGDEASP